MYRPGKNNLQMYFSKTFYIKKIPLRTLSIHLPVHISVNTVIEQHEKNFGSYLSLHIVLIKHLMLLSLYAQRYV
jgi:hypothetical protein